MISAAQIRAARALLGWTQLDLERESKVSLTTIKRMEGVGPGRSSLENVAAIKNALEAAGVSFIPENGGGVGVRLAQPAGVK